jgi:SAM-dependent methyltransferase
VLFSGLDMRDEIHGEAETKFENAEALSYDDEQFDYAVMHASIHHTRLPHKVLTELYRVSRKGFLAIESRDSVLIRLAQRFGLTEGYEVAGNFAEHGVNGTDIPNFIYRWTEREIEKTINVFAPHLNHSFEYRYSSHYPEGHGFARGMKIVVALLKPAYSILCAMFPKQQNHFAFFVHKPSVPDQLKPWIKYEQATGKIDVDREWIKNNYTKRMSR